MSYILPSQLYSWQLIAIRSHVSKKLGMKFVIEHVREMYTNWYTMSECPERTEAMEGMTTIIAVARMKGTTQ